MVCMHGGQSTSPCTSSELVMMLNKVTSTLTLVRGLQQENTTSRTSAQFNMGSQPGLSIIIFTLISLLPHLGNAAGLQPDPGLSYRRNFVREMMKGAWNSYRAHAWGEYAVFPITNEPAYDAGVPGKFQIGATILASLDTLYIMELKEEFELAQTWVKTRLNFTSLDGWIQINDAFEEYAASLLSAYFITNDYALVLKAQEIVESFLPNFISSTGLPYRLRNPAKDQINTEDVATYVCELGTFRLEFLALSNLTGKQEFRVKADHVTNFLRDHFPPDGLLRDTIDVRSGEHYKCRDLVLAESSFHLTSINDWLQNGNTQAREMFDRLLTSIIEHGMLKLDNRRRLLYLTERQDQLNGDSMFVDYCLSGGVYALAAMSNRSTEGVALNHHLLSIARNLTLTCRKVSKGMSAGLAPAKFSFEPGTEEILVERQWNKLYPYIAYSYFVLYRLTRDPVYRQWGWEMAQDIERYAKVVTMNSSGYAGFLDVTSTPPVQGGNQEPHFLGGTLKFLYLLFSDTSYYDLQDWIFNAKGHLMPVVGPSRLYVMKANEFLKTDDLTPGINALMYSFVACATVSLIAMVVCVLWWQRRERAPACGASSARMHFSRMKGNEDPIDFDSNYGPVFNGMTGLF